MHGTMESASSIQQLPLCHQRCHVCKDRSGSSAQHHKVGAVCFWPFANLKLSKTREKLLT